MPRIKFDIYLVCKFAIFPQGIFMGCRKLCKFYQWPGAGGQYCVCYRYNHYSNNPFGGQYPLGTTQYPLGTTQYDHNYESMISTGFPSGMELSRINLWCIIALQILNNLKPLQMLLFPFV